MELVLISVYSVVPLVPNLRAGPLQRVTLINGLENKETNNLWQSNFSGLFSRLLNLLCIQTLN